MALRLVQVTIPAVRAEEAHELSEDARVVGMWADETRPDSRVIHMLAPAEQTEELMDRFDQRFGRTEGFRLVLLPVEAAMPRPEPEAEPAHDEDRQAKPAGMMRVSREELYSEVTEGLGVHRFYLLMAGLSALVAAVGLVRDDVAVIIGAMVIAPLLGPNVALAMATTLGDVKLIRRAMVTNLAGVTTALSVALISGVVFHFDATVASIASRTEVGVSNIALALAAGTAGTLAYVRGLAGPVIGVMVAVALVPPLVVFGMMLSVGRLGDAWGALLLTVANVICVNLAGTVTFVLLGVRPRRWWEAERAKKASRISIGIWVALLAVLLAILVLSAEPA